MFRRRVFLSLFLLLPFLGEAGQFGQDGIDRSDPDFVKASLLVMGPGDALYTCAGHACLRLECEKFRLDYCFSYESENAESRVARFLAGKLKMGMFGIPTQEFLKTYAEEGRGIRAYPLDLPPDAKQRLWKLLDQKVNEGVELPYDFIKRGCAQSTLQCLFEAIRPYPITYPPWTSHYDQTMRELFAQSLDKHLWNMFFVNFLVGIDGDADVPKLQRVIIPADLLEFLRGVKVAGRPILTGDGHELLPMTKKIERTWFTPVIAACVVLALVLVGCWWRPQTVGLMLAVLQAVVGVVLIYLVFVSTLPATTWNWLIIPFNPLPLIFWKWRRRWALAYAVVLTIWLGGHLMASHRTTDPSFYVLDLAYIALYVRLGINGASFRRGF